MIARLIGVPHRHVAHEKFSLAEKNACTKVQTILFADLPKFARACGRVSVGGHPDKRPDSRPE